MAQGVSLNRDWRWNRVIVLINARAILVKNLKGKDKMEKYVELYGEKYRKLIESSYHFLLEREPEWGLDAPMDPDKFIASIIERAKRGD